MEEAKFSTNIKYRWQGYECQFTMRADEGSPSELLTRAQQAVAWLGDHGAVPNGNHQASLPLDQGKRVCPVCGRDDKLELIDLGEKYDHRKAWKCQRCKKWLPNGK